MYINTSLYTMIIELTYTYIKRDIYMHPKRHVHRSFDVCICLF